MDNTYPADDVEKKISAPEDITDVIVQDESTVDPHMHRSLKGRQVSMIAIAGTIGTGLFLGSGKALANGGPVGALLGYLIVGILVGMMMYSLGEMMIYDPSASGFIEFGARYIDPAFGFAMGWQFWFQTAMTCPVEIVAASIVIQYWDKNDDHLAIYVTVLLLGITLINLAGVKYFGEFEFWFAFIKIVTMLGLFIVCLVIDLGGAPDHDRRGFRYWKNGLAFNGTYLGLEPVGKARFLGFWAVLTQASFSYGGMEGLSSIALEASNPRKTMKTAIRAIFYRIVLLYIVAIFFIGICVASNDPNLLNANKAGAGTAAESPFVIAIQTSGIKALNHIINAVVLTSAFSSGNEFMYVSSRAMFMLAQQGQAPRIFSKVLRNGVPIYALATVVLMSLLAYLNCSAGAEVAFNWLSNITTLGSQITWIGIAWSWIRFNKGMKRQGIPRSTLPFRSIGQPYFSWLVVCCFIVIIFFNAWDTLKPFSASDFFSSYVNLGYFFFLFVGWKIVKKTKFVSYDEMDCSTHYTEGSVVVSRMAVGK